MWRWLCIGMLLAGVSLAAAQTTPVAPPTPVLQPTVTPLPTIAMPTFRFYRCSCTPSSVGVTSTPSAFGGAVNTGWMGSVYATSQSGAAMKAQRACSSASGGSVFNCLSCQCQ